MIVFLTAQKYRYFSYFSTETCCGYLLEVSWRGASNDDHEDEFTFIFSSDGSTVVIKKKRLEEQGPSTTSQNDNTTDLNQT